MKITVGSLLTHRWIHGLIWMLVAGLLLEPSAQALARLQDDGCTQKLKEAQEKFYDGKFDETIALTKECLDSGTLDEGQKKQAYELLGQALIAKEYLDQANDAIRKLLKVVPNYAPDPERVTPTFAQQVNKIKAEEAQKEAAKEEQKEEEGGFDMKWVYIGAGVVAAGVAVLLLTGKKSEETPSTPATVLPGPPPLP